MNDALTIYIDRLQDGHVEKIHETLSPEVLHLEDREILFKDPVQVQGEAYLAEDELILNLTVMTKAYCRCVVCNQVIPVDIEIHNAYHTQEAKKVKGALFNMGELLREMIFLEIPAYVECNAGNCPERQQIGQFLKKKEEAKEERPSPFDNLSLE